MSVAGGLWRALERGHALGCGAVQIFLKNQRQWAAPPLTADDIREFAAARRRTRIPAVFAHASYLINLAAPGSTEWARAVDAFTDELERGLARVAAALDEAIRRTSGYRIRVALENTAGGGGTVGRRPSELGAILGRIARPERAGVCLDTCHLFAAGYDIRTPGGWEAVVAEWAVEVGLERVLAFHLNDARAGLGSGLDRHEHIGQGHLGRPAFRRLLRDPRFARVPKVLETPKAPEPVADQRNLARLRALRVGPATGVRRPG
jgi:deoxyribonuclease-4